jgi:hypothetical protein
VPAIRLSAGSWARAAVSITAGAAPRNLYLSHASVPELHAEKVDRLTGLSHSDSCQSTMMPEMWQLTGYFRSPILTGGDNLPVRNANRGSERANHMGREMK